MQALLEQYLKRVSVNRATLMALFAAGDTDTDGLLDRPQAKATLLCAQPSISDTVLTTIWLEREKVWVTPRPANPPLGLSSSLPPTPSFPSLPVCSLCAAWLCAQLSVSDNVLTTIWPERRRYGCRPFSPSLQPLIHPSLDPLQPLFHPRLEPLQPLLHQSLDPVLPLVHHPFTPSHPSFTHPLTPSNPVITCLFWPPPHSVSFSFAAVNGRFGL